MTPRLKASCYNLLNYISDKQPFSEPIVDFYLAMVSARKQEENSNLPKIYSYTSNYCDQLMKRSKSCDKENERTIDLQSYDLLLFPILLKKPTKWSLVAIDLRHKTICLYQTKHWNEKFEIEPVEKLLTNYKKKMNIDPKKNVFEGFHNIFDEDNYMSQDSRIYPHNDFDSGAFICTCAEFLSRGDLKPYYRQSERLDYRHKIMYEIIEKKLLTNE